MVQFNIEELNQLIADKRIVKQKHPTQGLWVYKYTKQTQYEKTWCDIAMQMRGIVLNASGTVVAKSFDKFFNLEEHIQNGDILPKGNFEVFDKLDGSLINLFYWNNEWIFVSSGSFESEQVKWAKEIFEEKYTYDFLNFNFTYSFELIHPENQIVCDYGDRKELILLSVFDCSFNHERIKELPYSDAVFISNLIGCNHAKRYEYNNLNFLKDVIGDGKEGFVVRFQNGFRLKVKSEKYVALHFIATQLSNKIIWEHLKDGGNIRHIYNIAPDETFEYIDSIVEDLRIRFSEIQTATHVVYQDIINKTSTRKEFAEKAINYREISCLLFMLYDGKNIDQTIWKMIEPKYERVQFKNKIK